MAPAVEYGRSPQSPRRTRVHHPVSSYVPFFVFVVTLVVVVVVIVLLVGRLLAMMAVRHPAAGTPTVSPGASPRVTAAAGAVSTTVRGRGAATGLRPAATPLPVLFAAAHDPAGAPVHPARAFAATAPRIYAFVTLRRVAARAPVHFLWAYGPRHVLLADVPEHVHGPAYAAHPFLSYFTPDTGVFASGRYTVTVTLGGRIAAQGAFRVPVPSSPPHRGASP